MLFLLRLHAGEKAVSIPSRHGEVVPFSLRLFLPAGLVRKMQASQAA